MATLRRFDLYLVVLLFIASFYPVPSINGWAFRQTLGLGLLSLFIAQKLKEKFHWSVGLCFLNLSISGILHGTKIGLGTESILTVMTLLLFTCVLLFIESSQIRFMLTALVFIAIGNSLIMLYRYISTSDFENAWWVVTNHSLDASFVALMAPVIILLKLSRKIKVALLMIVSSAVLASKSNTGACVLISFPIFYFLSSKDYKKLRLSLFVALLAVPVISSVYGSKLLHDTGRFNAWILMMGFWKKNLSLLFGGGPGSYWVYSSAIQTGHFKFTWMHNDFLQQLFENGIIGLLSCVLLYTIALKRSFNRPYLFSMVVGYGIVSMTLYPSHLFFFQLIAVALIYLCFAPNKNEGNVCLTQ